ncbi:hypothetical protein NDU88_006574 [Pleurodeles waltl]|uniref:Uncharacterized protein n=1 Tax=Pleurodeles waltl TaxID=8319 RepID=A0AAV7ULE0_PLEWA|nr:hypothetical protein NDU88_006574 [Pleurodeles waltl]
MIADASTLASLYAGDLREVELPRTTQDRSYTGDGGLQQLSSILQAGLSKGVGERPCCSKLHESSLLAYFKKKPKLELLARGGEIELAPGWGVPMESAVTDALPIACGYSTTAELVHRPALSTLSQLHLRMK